MEKIFDRNSTVKEAKNYKPFAEAVEHIEWGKDEEDTLEEIARSCLLYTSPSPRD